MAEESQRALRHRAERLVSLKGSEAFQLLVVELEKKAARMARELTSRLLRGDSLDVTQRQIDYGRGFMDGMKYAVEDIVTGAGRTLERLDRGEEPDEPQEDYWSYGQQPE